MNSHHEASQPKQAAVLGYPITHSLSPVLHRCAYQRLGLTGWRYSALEVADVDQLADVFQECSLSRVSGVQRKISATADAGVYGEPLRWAGLSLTMPLKTVVAPFLDVMSPVATATGSVNTVTFVDGQRIGENTDVEGMVIALTKSGLLTADRAVVLGGGATAASALAAVLRLGVVDPKVVVRSMDRVGSIRAAAHRLEVTPEFLRWDDERAVAQAVVTAEVVISTVPVEAADVVAAVIAHAGALLAPGGFLPGTLLDVVYYPWPTRPVLCWREFAGRTVSGLAMLTHQAAAQVALMTGRQLVTEDVKAMGEAGRAALR